MAVTGEARGCRVLHVLHALEVGGKERVVADLAARGRAEGADDRILLFDRNARDPERDLELPGVPVTYLPRRGGLDTTYARRLREFLERENVAVVHAHNDSALVYAALALRRMRRPRARLVVTHHNLPSWARWTARLAARWADRHAVATVCVSDELAAELRARRWIRSARIVPNGVDLERYRPDGPGLGWRPAHGVDGEALLVALPARLISLKRHVDLIEATDLVRRHGPWVELALIGRGPEHDDLARRAAERPWVHLEPRVPDMPAFLREVDVVALVSDHEGSSMALLEALATGRAVIGTRVGSLPQVLDAHGAGQEVGLLVPPRSPEALAEALIALMDGERRRELGRRARAAAIERHGFELTWQAYDELYRGMAEA